MAVTKETSKRANGRTNATVNGTTATTVRTDSGVVVSEIGPSKKKQDAGR